MGRLFYPVVTIQLKTISGWRDFEFLVDTGADVTTIPSGLLSALGFVKGDLKTSKTWGVGSISVKTWELMLPIKIGKVDLLVHASAVDAESNTMSLLLGRKDI